MLTVFIQAVSAFADPALGAFRTKSDQILFGLSPTQPLSMDKSVDLASIGELSSDLIPPMQAGSGIKHLQYCFLVDLHKIIFSRMFPLPGLLSSFLDVLSISQFRRNNCLRSALDLPMIDLTALGNGMGSSGKRKLLLCSTL
jgi:hypothetical protein